MLCGVCNFIGTSSLDHFCCCSILGKRIPSNKYILTEDLVRTTLDCIPFLIPKKFNAVIGIARSGMIPATLIAEKLHLPLFSLNIKTQQIIPLGGGARFNKNVDIFHPSSRCLIVDDTSATGTALSLLYAIGNRIFPHRNYRTMVIFADDEINEVDYVGVRYNRPHYLEWCLYNSLLITNAAIVIDKVLVDRYKDHYFVKECPIKHKVYKFISMDPNINIINLLREAGIDSYDYVINPNNTGYRIGDEPSKSEIDFVVQTLVRTKGIRFIVAYHKKVAEAILESTKIDTLSLEIKEVLRYRDRLRDDFDLSGLAYQKE